MDIVRSIDCKKIMQNDSTGLLTREWLVTNGLGGYASGTLSGVATRRYHGYLISALPNPMGRTMMMNNLSERIRLPNRNAYIIGGYEQSPESPEMPGVEFLTEFRLEKGLPVWRFEIEDFIVEKRLMQPYLQNSTYIIYTLISGIGVLRLKLRPAVHFREHDMPVNKKLEREYTLTAKGNFIEISDNENLPALKLLLHGERGSFTIENEVVDDIFYRIEESRGYEHRGMLNSHGYFSVDISKENPACLVVSTEPWDNLSALNPKDALEAEYRRRDALVKKANFKPDQTIAAELVLAADQFVITPAGRVQEMAKASAEGEETKTVIAGYHWFTDWGRDTMISLEGLTLSTGRHREARYILRTFAQYIRNGLIPNMFPEGEQLGLYHTADATLWFFHALARYIDYTGDHDTLQYIYPKLESVIENHLKGTDFNIHADPEDGLLIQGEEGYQLTWMDAKVSDWVVTPRRGKAVEINALWYNALRLFEYWTNDIKGHDAAKEISEQAEKVYTSFNKKFWFDEGGYLYDVIEGLNGNDSACRPNQVFSISLTHPVLERKYWKTVLTTVRKELLTPVGLRSLERNHPDYKKDYHGDLWTRDAAYHQGTVWSWLIGPFIDAWLKLSPEYIEETKEFLSGLENHLNEACIGSVSEVFDAEAPFTPRGCIAQAWGVAEYLRCRIKAKAHKPVEV